MQLNGEAYAVERDSLIYDNSHPRDADNVPVTVSGSEKGVFARGEVLDFSEGSYVPHAKDGTASVIVAETTTYDAGDTEVTVPVYISGCFRRSECTSAAELTVSDEETLRTRGIYLK